jgi:outer membrane protein TolC
MRRALRCRGRWCAALTVVLLLGVRPVPAAALPEPLTLAAALQAGDDHPSVALGEARLARLEAEAEQVQARDDVELGAALEARVIDPSETATDQGHDDSRATLYARKRLYDFGHTRALEAAAASSVEGGRLRADSARLRHRLAVMQAFFDVLLADLEYARDNESMAVSYVEADRTRDRHELGQVSDADLLQRENAYQQIRMKRSRAQARQRSTRALLAQLLDQPDQLPSTLVRPDLAANDQPLPDEKTLVAAALAHDPDVQALRADLEAARLQVRAERTGGRPVLTGSLAAAANKRDIGSRNPLEAELRLEIPLYDKRTDAGVARARADFDALTARLRQQEYDVRQRVLEIWLDIQTLQTQREQVKVFAESRQLNFERAQAEYEMELKTDFGDALVGQSESELLRAQTEFGIALDRARLAVLTGGPYSPFLSGPSTTSPGRQDHD